MRRFHPKTVIFTIFFITIIVLGIRPSFGLENKAAVVIKLEGVINTSSLELIKEGMDYGQKINSMAIVLLLDTPGGILETTFDIIKLIEGSSIPVISFVYPEGAKAWSAGTFILLSSHVAAMAPYSTIGSCQPRAYPSGELVDDPKLVNALKEFLVQRAEMHGRNKTIAEEFVTKNRNIGGKEAKDLNVTDVVASTIEELLKAVNGMSVKVKGRQIMIHTENVQPVYFGASIRVRVLRLLSDPMIAYLLFTLGIYGIIFGFFTAGFEGEIIGGILLILGLIGLGLYLDFFVILLLILGGILVYVEMREPGLQFFGPGGVFCLTAGTLLLLRLDPSRWLIAQEWYWPFMAMILALTAILTGFSVLVLYKVFRSAKKRPTILKLIGESAQAIDEITPGREGFVRFHGEYWRARSDTTIKPGQRVKILAKEGPILIVEPTEE
ncbi:MAG: hypothetical protein AOA65_0716 [Candidatus Bathyarchaeota archaeon BA1]|nr:MAG: hypothetical protein AOA65_0716 [Candidatus Bathyarchaeota archaeon BA1]